jgi:hypothetical protein
MTSLPSALIDALHRALGTDAVDTSEESIARYSRNLLPTGDRRPAGVVYPTSTADVQAMVRLETFPEVCADIKRALGPNGVLSPGRYGIT